MAWPIDGSRNMVLDEEYWNSYANRGYIFARKFDVTTPKGSNCLDRIDKELRFTTVS